MTEPTRRDQTQTSEPRLKRLLCRRVNEQVDLAEHERCPYCYGTEREVVKGHHETFCDYRPEKDPIHFGFPTGGTRDTEG